MPSEPADRIRIKRESTVVTAVPNECVFCDAERAEALSQSADAAVDAGNLTKMMCKRCVAVWLAVCLQRSLGIVWRAIPDDGEEGGFRCLLTRHELQRFLDDDGRGISGELFKDSLATHDRIKVEEIRHRHPLLEAVVTGVVRVVAKDGNSGPTDAIEMPLAEVPSRIACFSKRFWQGFFL